MHLTPLTYILLVSTLLEFNPLFQAIKSMRSKSVKDVSPLTFTAIFVVGALWLFYGITIQSLPIIVGNAIKLFTSLTVIVIYFKYRKK